MNLERFKQIVESYGAAPARWPDDETESAQQFLSSSESAQQLLDAAEQFDQYLNSARFEPGAEMLNRIEAGIATQIAQTTAEPTPPGVHIVFRLIEWLMPTSPGAMAGLLRPTLAACLPLILGIGIGLNLSFDETLTLSTNEEIQLLALSQSALEEWSIE